MSTIVGQLQAFWQAMALHLWQCTIALAIVMVLSRLLRDAPARFHSSLWSAGLLKLFLPLPFLAPATGWLVARLGRSEAVVDVSIVRGAMRTIWMLADPWSPGQQAAASTQWMTGTAYVTLTLLWLAAAAALGYVWCVRARNRRDALCPASKVSPELRSKVASVARQAGFPEGRVVLTDNAAMPCIRGFRRSFLILPRQAAEQLSTTELAAIFVHETAHMRRWDVLRTGLQRIAILLFFFYPPLWIVLRHLNRSAELACDELVLDSGLPAETYATALAKTLRLGLFPYQQPAISGVGSSLIAERLRRIRQPGRYIGMFRHKLTLVLGFCAVATLSLMPISDLDLAVADTASVLTLPATGTPAAGAPTPQAAQEPVRVGKGTDHQEPRVVHRVEPSYPEEARAARLQGEVVIELIADAEGLVQEARVTQGVEGAPMLAEAAVEAIRQWRFEPLRIDDRPVPMIVTISVRFRLED